ncbi:hypothetical protein BGZ76_003380 [Entomortierella beljakovae]|nr:hypothetical protein BGZ76_003380 [Entomortierella beljakovae]
MESVFEIAKNLKEKTGKPVNLWMTGHSLAGGALAALSMARLQLPLRANDPLFKGFDPSNINLHNRDGSPRTVLQEMMARYNRTSSCSEISSSTSASTLNTATASSSTSSTGLNGLLSRFHLRRHSNSSEDLKQESHHQHHKIRDVVHNLFTHAEEEDTNELLVIRDVYTYASPRLGDTSFAKEFDKHHTEYMEKSSYSPVYYRIMIDKDIVPMLPPSCNADLFSDDEERMFPCVMCPKKKDSKSPSSNSHDETTEHLHQSHRTIANYGTLKQNDTSNSEGASNKTHMNSLLDYRHIGQMVCLSNQTRPPIVKPSKYQTDHSSNVLRTELEAKELIGSIDENLGAINNSNNNNNNNSNNGLTSPNSASTFCADDILQEMEKAKARHDLDSITRLRTPCTAEKFLLTFPGVMSHSPSAYQRNLMRTRYYYKSFPGSHLDRLIYGEATEAETFYQGEREDNRPAEGLRTRDSGVIMIQFDD